MKSRLSLIAAALLSLAACGRGDPSHARTKAPLGQAQSQTPAIEVSASELIAAYKANEVAADDKYKGRDLIVAGYIATIGKDIVDHRYVTFKADGELEFRKVQCMFDSEHNAELATLSKGQNLRIRGKCSGMMGNVHLEKCTIVPEAQALPAGEPATTRETLHMPSADRRKTATEAATLFEEVAAKCKTLASEEEARQAGDYLQYRLLQGQLDIKYLNLEKMGFTATHSNTFEQKLHDREVEAEGNRMALAALALQGALENCKYKDTINAAKPKPEDLEKAQQIEANIKKAVYDQYPVLKSLEALTQ